MAGGAIDASLRRPPAETPARSMTHSDFDRQTGDNALLTAVLAWYL
jgi:hypothetical protein